MFYFYLQNILNKLILKFLNFRIFEFFLYDINLNDHSSLLFSRNIVLK